MTVLDSIPGAWCHQGSPPGVTTDTLPSSDSAQHSDFIEFQDGTLQLPAPQGTFSPQGSHRAPDLQPSMSYHQSQRDLQCWVVSLDLVGFFQALGLGVDLTGWVKLGYGAAQVWLKCTENMHLIVQTRVATEEVRGRNKERKYPMILNDVWRRRRTLESMRGGVEARDGISQCRMPRPPSLEWCYLATCPPLISMPFAMFCGGEGWGQGVKFVC